MQIVLIAGLWLPRTVWTEVATVLDAAGHTAHPVALPGADSLDRHVALGDQITAVIDAVDHAADLDPQGQVVVVGHSAASALAWVAADHRATKVAHVVMVGGIPVQDGSAYADFFPLVDGVMPFPGWDAFEEADIADLSDEDKSRIEEIAVPAPGGVVQGTVRLTDPARYRVPVTLICPEYDAKDAYAWLEAGEIPELSPVQVLEAVDIATGHWPMLTAPGDLAGLLAAVADAGSSARNPVQK